MVNIYIFNISEANLSLAKQSNIIKILKFKIPWKIYSITKFLALILLRVSKNWKLKLLNKIFLKNFIIIKKRENILKYNTNIKTQEKNVALIHEWYSSKFTGGAEKALEVINKVLEDSFSVPKLYGLVADLDPKKIVGFSKKNFYKLY